MTTDMTVSDLERIALWMIGKGYATGHGDTVEDMLNEIEWQVKERVVEGCATNGGTLNPQEQGVS